MKRPAPPDRRFPAPQSVDPNVPGAPNLIPSKPKKPAPKPKRY